MALLAWVDGWPMLDAAGDIVYTDIALLKLQTEKTKKAEAGNIYIFSLVPRCSAPTLFPYCIFWLPPTLNSRYYYIMNPAVNRT